jgi:hypothetical protein
MKKILRSWLLTFCSLYIPLSYADCTKPTKCDKPTNYKTYYSYTIFLTKPDKQPHNFYLVLTSTPHKLFGGQPHVRNKEEPLIHFAQYKKNIDNSNPKIAFVEYQDFIDAINSDQPAHNIRIRSEERYITLSKIVAREFRNGYAKKTLEKIAHAGQ